MRSLSAPTRHRAELVDHERPAAAPRARLAEEHGAARADLDDEPDDRQHRQGQHEQDPADDKVERALYGHVEPAQLGVPDVQEWNALDVIDEGPRADDLEEARHDVHAHACIGAGPHDAQEVVVASLRERHDDPVDVLRGHDRLEVGERAQDACGRSGVSVSERLAVVEVADELHAILRVLGDLGGDGVPHLTGADDEHALPERGAGPDEEPRHPSADRHQDYGEGPEGDEHRHRSLGSLDQHGDDEQHPARGRQGREAPQRVGEVHAADAAPGLPIEAERPHGDDPVRGEKQKEECATMRTLVERREDPMHQGSVAQPIADPAAEGRSSDKRDRIGRHYAEYAQMPGWLQPRRRARGCPPAHLAVGNARASRIGHVRRAYVGRVGYGRTLVDRGTRQEMPPASSPRAPGHRPTIPTQGGGLSK